MRQCGNAGPQFRNIFRGGLATPTPAYVWATGQILAAALDLGMITGSDEPFQQAVQPLDRYLLRKGGTVGYAPPVDPKPATVRWWDDNASVSISLLQAFEQLHNPEYLSQVQVLWPFFVAGRKAQGERLRTRKH